MNNFPRDKNPLRIAPPAEVVTAARWSYKSSRRNVASTVNDRRAFTWLRQRKRLGHRPGRANRPLCTSQCGIGLFMCGERNRQQSPATLPLFSRRGGVKKILTRHTKGSMTSFSSVVLWTCCPLLLKQNTALDIRYGLYDTVFDVFIYVMD